MATRKRATPPTAVAEPAAPRPAFREIPTALVDDPAIAMRQTLDEDKLHELIDDIRRRGLLQPIGVVIQGDRFRLVWGHRRTVACRALQLATLPAMVFPAGTADEEAMKYAENVVREDVKAADEADYFQQLLELRCEGDVDRLAAMVGRNREFVEGRLLLLQGDAEVLAALRAGAISIGVAEWLNRCKDQGNRMVYLESAVKGGATVALVRDWVQRGNAYTEYLESGQHGPVPLTPPPGAAPVVELKCHFCGEGINLGPLNILYVHKVCEHTFLNRLLAQQRQEG